MLQPYTQCGNKSPNNQRQKKINFVIRETKPLFQQTRHQQAGWWRATPKIASPVMSMLHKKRGGNKEDNHTFMSHTNCQGIKN